MSECLLLTENARSFRRTVLQRAGVDDVSKEYLDHLMIGVGVGTPARGYT